jgi:hypothetical protein
MFNLCPVSPNHRPWIPDDVVNIGHLTHAALKQKDNGQSIALAGIGTGTMKEQLRLQLCSEVVLQGALWTNKLNVRAISARGASDMGDTVERNIDALTEGHASPP